MNNIKDIIYIFLFIILFCLCMKKNNIEKFTAQELTLDSFRKIMTDTYKVDIDAIRNLSTVANKLQEGGLTIPGDLKVTGKLTVEKDASLKKNLTVDNNTVVNKDLYVKDHTSSKRLDVRNNESVNGRWGTHFNWNNTGDNYIRGNLIQDQGDNTVNANITVNGNITSSGNVHATGNMTTDSNLTVAEKGTFKRVDILPGGGKWNTHFNYHANGENYISGGKLHVRGANNEHGHIITSITETGALRPRYYGRGNSIQEWPDGKKSGQIWNNFKTTGVQPGDIALANFMNNSNYNNAEWKDMPFWIAYDRQKYWTGNHRMHARMGRFDGHGGKNKWVTDGNKHIEG